jgi:FkbM family methyltransferase
MHSYQTKELIKQYPFFAAACRVLMRIYWRLRGAPSAQTIARFRKVVTGGGLVVEPANIPGRFQLDARSDLASRVVFSGVYEPEVSQALADLGRIEGLFVNIGANIGFFTVYAAKSLGYQRVVAIEPNPDAFARLQTNVRDNCVGQQVELHQLCIARTRGKVELAVVQGRPEYSSIDSIVVDDVRPEEVERIQVSAVPLADVVGERKVGLLFVDAEGAELQIFEGAADILRRDRPVLFFECSDPLLRKFGGSSEQLEKFLNAAGYRVANGLLPSHSLRHPYEGEAVALPVDRP